MCNIGDTTIMPVAIRIATEHDLEALTATLEPELSASHIAQRFEESRAGIRTMLVAMRDGSAIATISIGGGRFQREGSLRLFALNVGAAFRRKGVGTALVKTVEAIAAEAGLGEVNLEVTTDNQKALSLYHKLGYRICGDTVMGHWQNMRDDGTSETIEAPVYVMVKKLGDVVSSGSSTPPAPRVR